MADLHSVFDDRNLETAIHEEFCEKVVQFGIDSKYIKQFQSGFEFDQTNILSEINEDEKRYLDKKSDLFVKTVELEELFQYYEDNKFSMTNEQLQENDDRIAILQDEINTLQKQVDAETDLQLKALRNTIGTKDKDH
jgi:hypothetical protein